MTTVAVVLGLLGSTAVGQTLLTTRRVAHTLDFPVYVTHAPGDVNRLFIIEQTGRIRLLKGQVLLSNPFLNLDPVSSNGGERGLLGLAFHPDYANNGYFFVNYTNNLGNTVVARYRVSSNPDVADPKSAHVLLSIIQPFANHNGGWMAFGPDGFLYIAMGDGGDSCDSDDRAQDTTGELLGKMLRIDVNGDDFALDPNRNYAVPPDNPFVDSSGDDEIWAYGLRNPWRCAFDSLTGDLYVADVGQRTWEEINFQPAASLGGENYGWPCREATACSSVSNCDGSSLCTCATTTLIDPVHEYRHTSFPRRCSVTGGEVYRGCAIPDLQGTYFFADFCSAEIWSLLYNGAVTDLRDRTSELAPPPGSGLDIFDIASFGRDAHGEVYVCDHSEGEVFQIIPRAYPSPITITASDPPDGAIDARQPFDPKGTNPDGWRSIELTFSGPVSCVSPFDFAVTQTGGAPPAPLILELLATGADRLRLTLNRTIEPQARTRITYLPSNSAVEIAWLPGDVNADGTADTQDVLDWLDAHTGGPLRPEWSTDLDRSGVSAPADILREADLLNGGGSYEPFNGVALP